MSHKNISQKHESQKHESEASVSNPYWKTKDMADMTAEEWENLCDGCGKCCCIRLEDEETNAVYITDVSCKLLDGQTCRCTDYVDRKKTVPDCVTLTPDNISSLQWMPQTCAYRLVAEGKALPDYHHLVSGSKETIHERGMSVMNAVTSEILVSEAEQARRIVIWPGEPDLDV